jgi:hypothetical protein
MRHTLQYCTSVLAVFWSCNCVQVRLRHITHPRLSHTRCCCPPAHLEAAHVPSSALHGRCPPKHRAVMHPMHHTLQRSGSKELSCSLTHPRLSHTRCCCPPAHPAVRHVRYSTSTAQRQSRPLPAKAWLQLHLHANHLLRASEAQRQQAVTQSMRHTLQPAVKNSNIPHASSSVSYSLLLPASASSSNTCA